jgi:type II secretory pathway pseudopilin PulG
MDEGEKGKGKLKIEKNTPHQEFLKFVPHFEILSYLSQNLTFSQLLLGRVARGEGKARKNLSAFHLFTHSTRIAFTLAEIMIVMGIIGIIAEMVLPDLVHNVQNQVLKTAWKKAYSNFSQAYIQILQNEAIDFSSSTEVRDAFAPYFKIVKTCDSPGYDCWHSSGEIKTFPLSNGTQYSMANYASSRPGFIINDGMKCLFHADVGYNMGWVMVDVNGDKKPNVEGKDVFAIRFLTDRAIPFGENSTYGTCVPVSSGTDTGLTGVSCSEYYLLH